MTPGTLEHHVETTPEFEAAVKLAYQTIDLVWENADGLTLSDLRKAFTGLRDKIDHYIKEVGH